VQTKELSSSDVTGSDDSGEDDYNSEDSDEENYNLMGNRNYVSDGEQEFGVYSKSKKKENFADSI